MLPLSLDIPLRKRAAARRPETLLAHLGRDPASHFGTVNTPVYHASTLLFDSVEAYHEAGQHRLERRSEEHTYELQSLMRTSYAVFCLKKNNKHSNLNFMA